MHYPRTDGRRDRAPAFLEPYPRVTPSGATWREGAAIGAGVLVLLITAWLIWAALAEATLALVEAA